MERHIDRLQTDRQIDIKQNHVSSFQYKIKYFSMFNATRTIFGINKFTK